jgi:hypothetical protein
MRRDGPDPEVGALDANLAAAISSQAGQMEPT